MKWRGFTLIELLIVVAIIAILAAIAVPNFLEAQVRSKVSREHANMRSIATALEAYRTDNTRYPPDPVTYGLNGYAQPTFNQYEFLFLKALTTPVSYMTSIPYTVFQIRNNWPEPIRRGSLITRTYRYGAEDANRVYRSLIGNWVPWTPRVTAAVWFLTSPGPDNRDSQGNYLMFGIEVLCRVPNAALYDATNGTVSWGDIVRIGP
jgi:type II secretion system protein G